MGGNVLSCGYPNVSGARTRGARNGSMCTRMRLASVCAIECVKPETEERRGGAKTEKRAKRRAGAFGCSVKRRGTREGGWGARVWTIIRRATCECRATFAKETSATFFPNAT